MLESKPMNIYKWILNNKFLTICVLFTVFTMLDTIPILLGWWPPKTGINAYIHLLGRLFLHSILVFGIFVYDRLKRKVKSGILVYIIVFFISWGMLLGYLLINTLFVELHPDAFKDATRSYIFMYLLFGIVALIGSKIRSTIHNKRKKGEIDI